MEGKAMEYQAWQTCQAVLEFEHRSYLPPPFNILIALWAVVLAVNSICRKDRHPSSPYAGAGGVCRNCNTRQNPSSSAGRGRYCCCLALGITTETSQSSMDNQSEVHVAYQMHGTCLRLELKPSSCPNTRILVTTKTALNITIKIQEYTVYADRPLLLWKADPTEVREFACYTCLVRHEYPSEQKIYNQYSDLDKFEKVQAEWAITQLGKEALAEEKTES